MYALLMERLLAETAAPAMQHSFFQTATYRWTSTHELIFLIAVARNILRPIIIFPFPMHAAPDNLTLAISSFVGGRNLQYSSNVIHNAEPNSFLALFQRCGQPAQQQGRRMPLRILSSPTVMRRFRVSAFLAEVTQQIHSLRASGVISAHTPFTMGSAPIAL